MTDLKHERLFDIPAGIRHRTHVNPEQYASLYESSIKDAPKFWAEIAEKKITWRKKWATVTTGSFAGADIKWFIGGKLNIAENCVDRHLAKHGDKTAIIWIGNEVGQRKTLTYRELHEKVCHFASTLKTMGIAKGDRVALYMPMVPEATIAMLAIARIGAVHSVVFGGFSAKSLRDRIDDCGAKMVLTANEAPRGEKAVALKQIVDDALTAPGHTVKNVLVLQRTETKVNWVAGRDIDWDLAVKNTAQKTCEPEVMDAEDPLFILYTSGSTGKPKGLLHTTGGYAVFTAATFEWVFDHHDDDIYWCTADVGWITGHSYIVYGPLANAATVVMYEGVPTYPDASRFWKEIEANKVTIFYTAPTALRSLMKMGDQWVTKHNLSSLRVLGSVGEPINPKAWHWYHDVVGQGRTPIVDTWWQTETGGILISPLPGATKAKAGFATNPLFGIEPAILDPEKGTERTGETAGALVIKQPWPGIARTVFGDHGRYKKVYLEQYKGTYFTGDGATRDSNGYFEITGRMDDVIKVSGHRLGTFEIESALVSHVAVAESAVIGIPHEIKGEGIYAFVTLKDGVSYTPELKKDLIKHVRTEVGPLATPERIHWAPALPKTRSGKIMRRILRKIAVGEVNDLGDTSTLADPNVVKQLLEDRA